ncbi:hypothetical protein [Marinobacter lutaoensis]|jgi:hypothetical protein|uniref:hypothetical protein n=1 Tax=Marinobacter lutaoensis TaxID=135739 RepID=UPI000C0A4906|nr:hypothetical protein [Marinobacter lutaoensis]MBE01487.1 hypothetical protein [Marinobacter sp.]MBI43380.1 hypothetical protein [Oceanospirillales bacterium]NVD34185.1 hypothetical protein [Marinobacter lutaoensis]|tara:strand:- start:1957 stop:2559 length:603 start_codon:yes stop_codon:yes gene_type:complete
MPSHPSRYSLAGAGLLLILLALMPLSARAGELSAERVRGFIASLQALQTAFAEDQALPEDLSEPPADDGHLEMPDFSRIFSNAIEGLAGSPAYDRAEGIVESHGFADLSDWAGTGDRIYQAWMAIEMEQRAPQVTRDMAQAMAEIDNSPHLSAEQKAQMRAMMASAQHSVRQAQSAPAEDIAAIRPHLDALRAALVEAGE